MEEAFPRFARKIGSKYRSSLTLQLAYPRTKETWMRRHHLLNSSQRLTRLSLFFLIFYSREANKALQKNLSKIRDQFDVWMRFCHERYDQEVNPDRESSLISVFRHIMRDVQRCLVAFVIFLKSGLKHRQLGLETP